ncbi:MAP kinase-activating death domain protein [Trichinella spiralis]|uniref:MAP kinase-activating death domain protein n=1 Tax=Trichinella spiralis TaxID=6334 RepID=UPI0001EFBD73|nr:MAP kinase-activating death domain protein [Trichinella spiralis]
MNNQRNVAKIPIVAEDEIYGLNPSYHHENNLHNMYKQLSLDWYKISYFECNIDISSTYVSKQSVCRMNRWNKKEKKRPWSQTTAITNGNQQKAPEKITAKHSRLIQSR